MAADQKLRGAIAAVSTAAVLALGASPALGQAQGAGAMFEGRPAMAGAQGGQGAQAGPPQGGLGVQGSDSQQGLNLRKPGGLDSMPALPRDPGIDRPAGGSGAGNIAPGKDAGVAPERRDGADKARRAVKRVPGRPSSGGTDGIGGGSLPSQ